MVVEQLHFVPAQTIFFALNASVGVATVWQRFAALHQVDGKRKIHSVRSRPDRGQTLQRSIHHGRMQSILLVTPIWRNLEGTQYLPVVISDFLDDTEPGSVFQTSIGKSGIQHIRQDRCRTPIPDCLQVDGLFAPTRSYFCFALNVHLAIRSLQLEAHPPIALKGRAKLLRAGISRRSNNSISKPSAPAASGRIQTTCSSRTSDFRAPDSRPPEPIPDSQLLARLSDRSTDDPARQLPRRKIGSGIFDRSASTRFGAVTGVTWPAPDPLFHQILRTMAPNIVPG